MLHFCSQFQVILFPFQQPNARAPSRDNSYVRIDSLHLNGMPPKNSRIPMHLTNGYAENMMADVSILFCIRINTLSGFYFFLWQTWLNDPHVELIFFEVF